MKSIHHLNIMIIAALGLVTSGCETATRSAPPPTQTGSAMASEPAQIDRETAKKPRPEADKPSQQVGDLLVQVESLRLGRDSDGRSVLLATIFLANTNASTPIAVALNDLSRPTLLNRRGDSLTPMALTGVAYTGGYTRDDSNGFTEIPAGRTVPATITFYRFESSLPQEVGDYPPYRLQAEIFVGNAQDGRLANVKKHNLMIDVEDAK